MVKAGILQEAHVLHDKDREGEIGRQPGKQNIERRGTAGGDADG
jgi:hypothetical protein